MVNPLIEFTNLLHQHGSLDAKEVRSFKERHSDAAFLRKAAIVELAFEAQRVGVASTPEGASSLSQPSPDGLPAPVTRR